MRLCFLAPAQSIHTQKWVSYFANNGYDVHLISFEKANIKNVTLHHIKMPLLLKNATFPLKFIFALCQLRILLRQIKPDVLHSHYLTNNGFFGALCNFHPYVVSAWGSDVLSIPENPVFQLVKPLIARFVLKRADIVTCDAIHMAEAIKQLGATKRKNHYRFQPDVFLVALASLILDNNHNYENPDW